MKNIFLEIAERIDNIFTLIPIKVYAVLTVFCTAILIQAVYQYTTQEEPVNFTFVYDSGENIDNILDEVNSYGGAMIVSYDRETGEIIGKRSVGDFREAGVLSITEDEWELSNKNYPKGSKIVLKDSSPYDVIEYAGGIN